MAKNGKQAPKTKAAETQTAAKEKDYSKNVWLNYVANGMIHDQAKKDDPDRTFKSVTVNCPESKSGLATIAVNDGQVKPSTKKNGAPVEGFSNVLLGDADKTRDVSIATKVNKKGKGTEFETIQMTNAEIGKMFEAEKAKYRESQKAKSVDGLDVPEQTAQEEAQAEA